MTETAATLTYLFAVGAVLLGLLLFIVVVTRAATGQWLPKSVEPYVRRYALWAVAGFGITGFLLSLWYSEIVGFAPCTLCWFSRTMMYPIALIGTVAAIRKDVRVWPYTLALSTVGMLISGYHHLYQVGFVSGSLCDAFKNGGDCAKLYVYEFGFVTLPLMGFVVFAAIALLSWLIRKQ